MWSKLKYIFSFRWLKKPVKTVPTVKEETPVKVETPVQSEPTEKDTVDDGNWKKPDYQYIVDNVQLDEERIEEIKDRCALIMENKERYLITAEKIGCPWWFIPALHYRESSLSFNGVLHNGQEILGTGRKTTWVPRGRGPFRDWEESAEDVLRLKNYHKKTDWSLAKCAERSEYFNGLGYRYNIAGEYSPYVLAGTSFHDETGKYVSDGKLKRGAVEKQLGTLAIWKGLELYYGVQLI